MRIVSRDSKLTLRYVAATELSDVFISYVRKDKDLVDNVLAAIDTHHGSTVTAFRDVESVRAGELWDEALTHAVFNAQTFVAFLSDAYRDSTNCMFELMLFLNRRCLLDYADFGRNALRIDSGVILPFRLQECQIPELIARIHAPIVPEERPLSETFLDDMRCSILSSVPLVLSEEPSPFERLPSQAITREAVRQLARNVIEMCQTFEVLRHSLTPAEEIVRQSVEFLASAPD